MNNRYLLWILDLFFVKVTKIEISLVKIGIFKNEFKRVVIMVIRNTLRFPKLKPNWNGGNCSKIWSCNFKNFEQYSSNCRDYFNGCFGELKLKLEGKFVLLFIQTKIWTVAEICSCQFILLYSLPSWLFISSKLS